MRGTEQATLTRGRTPRAEGFGRGLSPRPVLTACCAFLLLLALGDAHLSAARPLVVEGVEVASEADSLTVRIVTTAADPPAFETFSLRDPDRLVLQLARFRWGPRFNKRLSAGLAGVHRVRVAQYQSAPPVTRLVFDLSVAPERLRYRTVSRPGVGDLEVIFSPPAPSPAAVSAPPGISVPTSPPQTVEPGPPPPEPEPPASVPPEQERPTPEQPEQIVPAPDVPAPPPAAERQAVPRAASAPPQILTWVLAGALALLLVAVVAAHARHRLRARRRHAKLQQSLHSDDVAARSAALRPLAEWPVAELRAVHGMLLEATEDSSPQVADQAKHLLRVAFPASALVSDLAHGPAGSRADAAALLAIHGADIAAEPLFEAVRAAPLVVQQAAFDGLVGLVRCAPLRPLLLALLKQDEEARHVAAEVIRAAGPGAARPLIAALDDTDESVRCGAIEALLLIAPEGSGRAISARLSDPVPQVRARAARALGILETDSHFRKPLLHSLHDSSAAVQQAAALSLARIGGENLTELLTALDQRAAEHPDLRVAEVLLDTIAARCRQPIPALASAVSGLSQSFAAGLLRALERAGRLDEWVQSLGEEDSEKRAMLVSILRAAAAAGISSPLLRGLEAAEPKTQQTCAELLSAAKERAAMEPLSQLLAAPHESVRAAAAHALGDMDGADAVTLLVPALKDPAAPVRTAAARALGRAIPLVGPEPEASREHDAARAAAVGGLTRALEDPVAEVRASAAGALGALQSEEGLPTLIELALRDPEQFVKAAAVGALGKLPSQDVLPLLMDVVNDPDPELRSGAIEVFGRAGDPAVAEVLVNALQDEDVTVRKTAGRALWDIASSGHVDSLAPHIKSPDPRVRAAVIGVIGKVRAAEHAPSLAEAATDPDPFVRAAVMNALRSHGPAAVEHAPAVIERLSDVDAFVRASAVDACAAMLPESEDTAGEILHLATDPDPEVREHVAAALLAYADHGIDAPLIGLLADPARRPHALQLLHEADEEQLRNLVQAARRAPEELRRAATDTLSYLLSTRWTVGDFQPELSSLDPEARMAGLEGLALVATPEAMEEVARLLKADPSTEIRIRALQILAESSEPAAREAVRTAAQNDPDLRVRNAAALLTEYQSPPP